MKRVVSILGVCMVAFTLYVLFAQPQAEQRPHRIREHKDRDPATLEHKPEETKTQE